jgi:hypothetical protein
MIFSFSPFVGFFFLPSPLISLPSPSIFPHLPIRRSPSPSPSGTGEHRRRPDAAPAAASGVRVGHGASGHGEHGHGTSDHGQHRRPSSRPGPARLNRPAHPSRGGGRFRSGLPGGTVTRSPTRKADSGPRAKQVAPEMQRGIPTRPGPRPRRLARVEIGRSVDRFRACIGAHAPSSAATARERSD